MKKIIFLLMLLIVIPATYSSSVIMAEELIERYDLKVVKVAFIDNHNCNIYDIKEETYKYYKKVIENNPTQEDIIKYREELSKFYSQEGEVYVILDDNVKCKFMEFVYEGCGKEYTEKLPCVKEGEFVWPFEHCCDGSEAYNYPGYVGQTGCVNISEIERIENEIIYNQRIFLIISTIIILAIGFLIFYIIKKIIKRKR